MPAPRPIRRTVTNENEENATTRVTRAKAAALSVVPNTANGLMKQPLQRKTSQLGASDAIARKRTALGDVSNVPKQDGAEAVKKPISVAKAAQPTGIQKVSRTNSTRSILTSKDRNSASKELKRPASTTSTVGNVAKKRAVGSSSSRNSQSFKDEPLHESENVAPSVDAEGGVKAVTETIKTTTTYPDGRKVEKEMKREERIVDALEAQRQRKLKAHIQLLDQEDDHDPLMVGEYVYEILTYMKELEVKTAPNPAYMDNQNELEWRMRGVLVDWLLEVHAKFGLLPETFYLTVNIIDRFLSCKPVQLERLQLVGVTAMFIASKYEEVLSPHIGNFSHVADDGFTDQEILSAERYILAALKYDLSFPNPMHFMRRISKADGYDIHTRTLAKYLLEISLLDHRFLHFAPSLNAAAAMHLSRIILEKGPWDDILQHYSGYSEEDIRPVVQTMIDYLQGPVKHDAFYKKYAAKKFVKASLHARAWAKKYSGSLEEAIKGQSP